MRIMIDTNVIISAALFPNGRAAKAFYKAMLPPYEPMICDYIVEELRKKFIEKFPDKQSEMEEFLHNALNFIELVNTPDKAEESEELIRDPKDRPILRAARKRSIVGTSLGRLILSTISCNTLNGV